MSLADRFDRPLKDLRMSVTDRCNFRCSYCMPKEAYGKDFPFLPRAALLSFEELTRLARLFVELGVRKIRLTGGEPLLRRDLERLVAMLAGLVGLEDLTLTTNGALLAPQAESLKRAGLSRVTVSLDALEDATFRSMNDVDFPVSRVLEGIAAAAAAGLTPVKVNMVVKRGVNQASILPMAEHFRFSGHALRFIEYMDVGSTNGWRLDDVVPASEIVAAIARRFPLDEAPRAADSDVARRYRYRDGAGEIGIIASVSEPFCGACSRARLTADGELYTCLFGSRGHDLKARLRGGASDTELLAELGGVWRSRIDRYSELRSAETQPAARVEMSRVGG